MITEDATMDRERLRKGGSVLVCVHFEKGEFQSSPQRGSVYYTAERQWPVNDLSFIIVLFVKSPCELCGKILTTRDTKNAQGTQ